MNVELNHIDEFEAILESYIPSERALSLLGDIPLVIFLGITGAGRNTIINHLLDTGKYHFIISDTTRPPKVRDGKLEQDGVQYHFRSEEDVLADLRAGDFLEAEVIHNQQVSGISIRELDRATKSGKIPINEVDLAGTKNIIKVKPDTKMFFIVPPTYDVWLQRLHAREDMHDKEFANRLKTAVKVLEEALAKDYFIFIINDSSLESAQRIDKWLSGTSAQSHHEEAKNATRALLETIQRRSSTLD